MGDMVCVCQGQGVILLVLDWLFEVTAEFSFVVYWPNDIRLV
jgi:hypothetical protein